MALILTRPGGRASLLAATHLGCQGASEQALVHMPSAADNSLVHFSALQVELGRTKRMVGRIALRLGIFLPEDVT
jgi:hypothetical protein